jgi:prefoldin subunit 5
MADKQIYIDRECEQANQYLQEQINTLNITKDELNDALDLVNQTPCIFDSKMFK